MAESTIFESLPYIDALPTPTETFAAQSLISYDLSHPADTPPQTHPRLPDLLPSCLSPFITAELARVAAGEKLVAIDTSRYETSDLPSAPKIKSKKATDQYTAESREALQRAYTASTYLSSRTTNLALLDSFGKNSWLISNASLEDELRAVEQELKDAKEEIDRVVIERQAAQEGVRGEMEGLAEGWRRSVGRVLETEVGAEDVRREILGVRRGVV
ncbi:Pre-mRNA-splicing factor SPF27 [Calycina marina]|uniref:Pre-mRNA-splicing factor SPF27 n=1 Tax=Calycina marina TaxID=1763456 RepID=A0A9P7YYY2_9HELO|nr:Pre-mRNA-splicing factor SPF27 [Calycina marina]